MSSRSRTGRRRRNGNEMPDLNRSEFIEFKKSIQNQIDTKFDVLWKYFVHLWQKVEGLTFEINNLEQHSRLANVIVRGMRCKNINDEAGMRAEFRDFVVASGCGELYANGMNFFITFY